MNGDIFRGEYSAYSPNKFLFIERIIQCVVVGVLNGVFDGLTKYTISGGSVVTAVTVDICRGNEKAKATQIDISRKMKTTQDDQ